MIFVILALFIILRIPSLFEPHWYGDEGIYASVAYAIENGKKLYLEVYDNRLPGIYYLYALGTSEWRIIWIRSANILAGVLTLVYIYKIGNQLKLSKYIVAGLVFALLFLGSPIWEGAIANTENFFIPFTAAAVYVGLRNQRSALIPGILFGIAFLFKFNPFFTCLAFAYYTVLIKFKQPKHLTIYLLHFAAGFGIPFILTCIFMFSQGILGAGLQYALLNNTGYIEKYANEGIPLTIRLMTLACLVIVTSLIYIKNKISKELLLIILLFAFDTFSVFFSGRQYTHYLLQMILSISLLVGYINYLIHLHPKRLSTWLITSTLVAGLVSIYVLYKSIGDIGNQVNINPIDYYRSFYNGVQHKRQPLGMFTFFTENNLLQEAKYLHSTLGNERHVFYTNESWIYDYLKINPPTIFVAIYHNYFIPHGIQRYLTDVEVYRPDSILVDKKTERQVEFDAYLQQHYKIFVEHAYFVQYRRFK